MKYTIGAEHNGVSTLNVFATAISLGLHGVILYLLFLFLMNNSSINKNKINFSIGINFSEPTQKNIPEAHKVLAAENPVNPFARTMPATRARVVTDQGNQKLANTTIGIASSLSDNEMLGQTNNLNGAGTPHRSRPLLINSDIKIPYPEQARARRIEGTVRMKLTVAESGKVIDADVISGPAYGLRQAALLVARKLFFLPATDEQGHAMVAHIEHEVIFRLRKAS